MRRTAVLAVALAAAGGCGGPEDPPTVPVTGTLVYRDGAPVPRAHLTLTTTVDGKLYRAQGVTGPDGGFRLTTFRPDDGAVAGDHQVAVSSVPGGDGPAAAPTVPPQYGDPDATGLRCAVAAPEAAVRLEIDRPAGRKK